LSGPAARDSLIVLVKVSVKTPGICPGDLALYHRVRIGVDGRRHLGAREDKEAGPIPADLADGVVGDKHPGQADRDVEVPGSSRMAKTHPSWKRDL
jgi:hypothetical protein